MVYGIQTVAKQVQYYMPLLRNNSFAIEVMDFGKSRDQSFTKIKNAYSPVADHLYSIHAPFVDQCLCSLDKTIRAYSRCSFELSIRGAMFLGIQNIVLHHNIFPTLSVQNYIFKEMCDSFLEYLDTIQRTYQVTFFIENVLDPTPDILHSLMLYNSNDHIKICFDVAHAYLSKTQISQWVDQLQPWIGYVHIADTMGIYDDHLPCGLGCIDWENSSLKALLEKKDVVSIFELSNVSDTHQSIQYFKEKIKSI